MEKRRMYQPGLTAKTHVSESRRVSCWWNRQWPDTTRVQPSGAPLGENIEASVTLHDRLSTKDNPDGKTVGRRVKLWSEAEAAIWNENFTVPVAPKTKKKIGKTAS